jgi:hypothetical protein
VKVVNDWLWCSGRIGNKPELGLGCLGSFLMDRVRDRLESTGYEVLAIVLCGSLLWLMFIVGATWSPDPFFFWTGDR